METNEEVSQSSSKSNNNPPTTEVPEHASEKETVNVLTEKINTININTTQQVINNENCMKSIN